MKTSGEGERVAKGSSTRDIATANATTTITNTSSHSQQQLSQRSRLNTNSPYELTTDDSFSEERVGASASWEIRSIDSEEHHQRKAKKQYDRRKAYDTTTPTLIDEEDEDETEIVRLNTNSFEQQNRDAESGSIRRTPGATMYKSAYSQDDSANSSMRRTPGASSMYRIDTTSSNGSEKQPPGLGFGLTLSTPVTNSEQDHPNHPPSERKDSLHPWGSNDSSPQSQETEKLKPEPRGPFSFAPWARNAEESSTRLGGSFSPHILRLTEDIGNLLQDEEEDDDEYTVDLPSVLPGTQIGSSCWSNVYNNRNPQPPALPHRKSSQITTPKPRRNESVDGFRGQGGQGKSNLVLGGAFAPPSANVFPNRPRGASFSGHVMETQIDLNPNQQSHSFEWPYSSQQQQQPSYRMYSEMQATANVFVPSSSTATTQSSQYLGGEPPTTNTTAWGQEATAREGWRPAVVSQYPNAVPPAFGQRGTSPSFWHGGQQSDMYPSSSSSSQMPLDAEATVPTTGRKEPRRRHVQRGARHGQRKKGVRGVKGDMASATSQDVNEENPASASEAELKKEELVDSPQTRAVFKEFYRTFRAKERQSFKVAEEYALKVLEDPTFPQSVYWKVYLELADLSKRSNRYVEARRLYQKVCQLQPYASQGWLEFSKLEEECGNMNRVSNILHNGLTYCDLNENLLTRAVKHQEKMGNIANARGLLSRLKDVGVDKVWRTVLEGALLELRAGRVLTARRVLKYLMHHVPWYGPLYLEAYRLEKDQDETMDALLIVERGLNAIPRYGPLWFGAFRLCEEIDMAKRLYHLPSCITMVERATASISKELVWKVHLEAAQMLERAAVEESRLEGNRASFDALIYPARRRVATTVLTCPNNLRWKVWLTAARVELGSGNTERARMLFRRAHAVVPLKGKSSTLIEFARFEEFVGDTELARAILCKGRSFYVHDWKVWLESVLLEVRCCRYSRAIETCNRALEIHQGTGRLWATLVQLRQIVDDGSSLYASLSRALGAVPKSGEVWCEGGRIHLNPFSKSFDLGRARRHLSFATRFTPQYGDGFVESVRLELIEQWLQPIADSVWEMTLSAFDGSKDSLNNHLTKYILDVTCALAHASSPQSATDQKPKLATHGNIVSTVRAMLSTEQRHGAIDLSAVLLACVNADPNYGLLWFHCRQRVTDTPRRIIEDATNILEKELCKYAYLYLAAMVRRKAILSMLSEELANADENSVDDVARERLIDSHLQRAVSISEIFHLVDPSTGVVLFEGPMNGSLFATAVSDLNRRAPVASVSSRERKSMLFGNDALFP